MSTNNDDFDMAKEYDFTHAVRGPVIPPNPNQTRMWVHVDMISWIGGAPSSMRGVEGPLTSS